MRKRLVALGIILLFIGLISASLYNYAVGPVLTPKWLSVNDIREKPTESLTVEGNLTQGDQFRVSFLAIPPGPSYPSEAGVTINITDPVGHVEFYDIGLEPYTGGGLVATTALPQGTANYTGTYRVYAEAQIAFITYLTLQRRELVESEIQYPYRGFAPVGIVILLFGAGTFLFGVRNIKRESRMIRKQSSNPRLQNSKKSS